MTTRIRWVSTCVSTQDLLWSEHSDVEAIITLNQSGGRGRRGKSWISAPNKGIALSCRVPTDGLAIDQLPLISLAAGVALHAWIEEVTRSSLGPDLALKWPNDLVWKKGKLAGILCESRFYSTRAKAIVGIGINLSRIDGIPVESASLEDICSSTPVIQEGSEEILRLIERLSRMMTLLRDDPSSVLKQWRERALPIGTVMRREGVTGLYKGIDDHGALLLDMQGQTVKVDTGEVELISIQANKSKEEA